MAKKIIWKENHLVNLKLKENLYTVGQMLVKPYMMFFKISNALTEWKDVDLNKIESLFCVCIGTVVFQKLAIDKIKSGVSPVVNPQFPKYWIKPHINYEDSFPFKGGVIN